MRSESGQYDLCLCVTMWPAHALVPVTPQGTGLSVPQHVCSNCVGPSVGGVYLSA